MEGKEEQLSASMQLGEKISLLPADNQTFYIDCIIHEVDDKEAYHAQVLAVLNFELIVIDLKKARDKKELITIDSLKQLLPWVRDENRDAWETMLATADAERLFSLLDRVLESRKELLIDSSKHDFEKMLPSLVEMDRQNELSKRVFRESATLTYFSTRLKRYSFNMFNVSDVDSEIQQWMTMLEKHNKEQHPFYQELLAQRHDAKFKEDLENILRMQIAINAIDEGLPLTHEKLGQVIQLFDENVRKHFEPHDTTREPRELFAAFKQHLNGLIDALNTVVISYKRERNMFLISFPNTAFRETFLSQLDWTHRFSPNHPRFPDAQSLELVEPFAIGIRGYKTPNGEIAFELPTAQMANKLRRLLRDQDLKLSEDNHNAICLPNALIEGNQSALVQMPVEMLPIESVAKYDVQRASRLLSLAWFDAGSVFQLFPKDLIGYIAAFVNQLTVNPPPTFPFKDVTSEINALLVSESLHEENKAFYQQMLDRHDVSFHKQINKVLQSELADASNEALIDQKEKLIMQSDLELAQVEKNRLERIEKNNREQIKSKPILPKQRNVEPLPQKPQVRQKEPVSFFWALLKGMFWVCFGACIGLVVFVAPIPVAPMLFIGWSAGLFFGLSAMESGFSNILGEGGVATSSLFWGGGLASIGAVIGSIVGTFLLPGFGTLTGASVGALMGVGVGVGVALVTGPLIRLCTWLYDAYQTPPLQQLSNDPVDVNQMKGLGANNQCVVDTFEEVPQGGVLFTNRVEENKTLNPTFSNGM